jgi:integrase
MSGTILADNKKPGTAETARARHRRYQLPCTPEGTPVGPLIRQLLAAVEADVKDKSYRESPVGQTVWRYLRAMQYAGMMDNSFEAYEGVLAKLALTHDDLAGVGEFCERPELLEDFLYMNWATKSENTRAQRYRILNGFCGWCVEKGDLPFNPVRSIRKPKAPRNLKERRAYDQEIVSRLINAQESLRDRCALGLFRLALRRNDVRMLQIRDIDLIVDTIQLNHAKGGKRQELPIVFLDLTSDLSTHGLERRLEAGGDPGDEYLLYARNRRTTPMNPSSVHRWFKRCLAKADLPQTIQMHELRHTAADHIWRRTGNIVLAQLLLRHQSPATTAAYLHPSADDLRAALKLVEEAQRDY